MSRGMQIIHTPYVIAGLQQGTNRAAGMSGTYFRALIGHCLRIGRPWLRARFSCGSCAQHRDIMLSSHPFPSQRWDSQIAIESSLVDLAVGQLLQFIIITARYAPLLRLAAVISLLVSATTTQHGLTNQPS
jgi:hypothetical protein